MTTKPTLAAWEYPAVIWGLTRVVFAIITAGVTAPFRGQNGTAEFKRHVLYAGMRAAVEKLSIRHFHALLPTTSENYTNYAKRKGFKPEMADIGDGTLGCWIGHQDADTILVWFHGGGFALMGTEEHMDFLHNLVIRTGNKVAVFILQYDVAPQAKYPRQLWQANASIRYLTEDLGKSYSQLIICGDSAGGSLSAAILGHLSHPHPKVPPLANNGMRFKGALLVSPWVGLDIAAPSFKANSRKDCLSVPGLRSWTTAFMGDAHMDNYNSPLGAPAEWWKDIQADSVLILAGSDEVLLDDILAFAEKLTEHNETKVQLLVTQGEAHNPPVSERQLKINGGPGEMEKKLYEWVSGQA
ncbi:Alpha/Beta hydrolase protein [Nemania abortiva]|nr:Alpha/Beta hydrolase protein [Nemania abortiva]